jgi:hypothetical protein
MANEDEARRAVADLMPKDEKWLYEELANRARAINVNPALGNSFIPKIPRPEILGPEDSEFGKIFFERWSRQAYNLVCGTDSSSTQDRQRIQDAFGLGKESVSTFLALALATHFLVAPAVASVIAVIAIRLFFSPAIETMCAVWKSKLPPL